MRAACDGRIRGGGRAHGVGGNRGGRNGIGRHRGGDRRAERREGEAEEHAGAAALFACIGRGFDEAAQGRYSEGRRFEGGEAGAEGTEALDRGKRAIGGEEFGEVGVRALLDELKEWRFRLEEVENEGVDGPHRIIVFRSVFHAKSYGLCLDCQAMENRLVFSC